MRSPLLVSRRLLLPSFLAITALGCGSPGARVPQEIARIQLEVRVTTRIGDALGAACVRSVEGVLRGHGFVVGPEGSRVSIEVALQEDLAAAALPPSSGPLLPEDRFDQMPVPERVFTADLTATAGLGEDKQTLRASGSGPDPCAPAAERLWEQLVAALTPPR